MGNPRGVKRDSVALEKRRLDAARLIRKGHTQAEVARRLGVSTASVCRWVKALKKQGPRALKAAGRFGRKPRLNRRQIEQIRKGLRRGPEAMDFSTGLWTLPRVGELIEKVTGISYHPGHVWRILRSLGWSCQRPTKRAMERDEAAIVHWKRNTWPALKKKPEKKAESSSSSTRAD